MLMSGYTILLFLIVGYMFRVAMLGMFVENGRYIVSNCGETIWCYIHSHCQGITHAAMTGHYDLFFCDPTIPSSAPCHVSSMFGLQPQNNWMLWKWAWYTNTCFFCHTLGCRGVQDVGHFFAIEAPWNHQWCVDHSSSRCSENSEHWDSEWLSGWWFQTFFIFNNIYIWGNPSHWLIFFKMVKTTNQLWCFSQIRISSTKWAGAGANSSLNSPWTYSVGLPTCDLGIPWFSLVFLWENGGKMAEIP